MEDRTDDKKNKQANKSDKDNEHQNVERPIRILTNEEVNNILTELAAIIESEEQNKKS